MQYELELFFLWEEETCLKMLIYIHGFIQAVLLMSVFEKILSFRMLYFVKNDNKSS